MNSKRNLHAAGPALLIAAMIAVGLVISSLPVIARLYIEEPSTAAHFRAGLQARGPSNAHERYVAFKLWQANQQ